MISKLWNSFLNSLKEKGIYLSIWFVVPVSPWLTRGANHDLGLSAGVFALSNAAGQEDRLVSFRVDYTM